jgi:murein DD-endopeptidase MepM/ murein hydrolase activator NlpD
MARFVRASLLLIALGAAALVLPSNSVAAANTGGAAPSGMTTSTAANGGAAVGIRPATPAAPPSTATAARTGGAVPGQRPPQKVVPRPVKPKTTPKPSAPAPDSSTVAGVFPVVGPFSFGGADARFGAQRNGHIHQGQDVVAASGQSIVSPLSGTIVWKANQPAGAGIYVILHGGDGRDYAFMHIKRGTTLVSVGEAVHQGQQLAQVGATGDATGPHLHFEIWVGGWGTKTGQPIDPLPQLKRWAGL